MFISFIELNIFIYHWYSLKKETTMAKNTSILLGDYFDRFITKQIQTGKYSSASEVVRAALRMFEHSEIKKLSS
ncbi:putative addiction module antidote protein [compost metagenome]